MPVILEVREGVAHLVLDDPPLNILTRAVLAGIRDRLGEALADSAARVVLLSARGRHFSAGASVEEHLPGEAEEMIPEFMDTVAAIHGCPFPVVAAIHGRCLGGALELVLAADLRIAGQSALLGVPEIRLGVFPPAACVQLPRLADAGLAAEMILTGEPVDADTAARGRLVRRVVPDDAVLDEATELARRMSGLSGTSLRAAKKALRVGMAELPTAATVTAGVTEPGSRQGGSWAAAMTEAARIYTEELMQTSDAEEGLRSFMEKRTPQWSHR